MSQEDQILDTQIESQRHPGEKQTEKFVVKTQKLSNNSVKKHLSRLLILSLILSYITGTIIFGAKKLQSYQQQNQQVEIKTYQDCLEKADGQIINYYPLTCLTSDLLSFVAAIPLSIDPEIDWKEYTSNDPKLSLNYPSNMTTTKKGWNNIEDTPQEQWLLTIRNKDNSQHFLTIDVRKHPRTINNEKITELSQALSEQPDEFIQFKTVTAARNTFQDQESQLQLRTLAFMHEDKLYLITTQSAIDDTTPYHILTSLTL